VTHFEDGAVGAFATELHETLPYIVAALDAAERDRTTAPLAEAHRLLHCLKGAAGMVGLPAFAYLLDLAEDLLERSFTPTAVTSRDRLAMLRGCLPRLAEYMTTAASAQTVAAVAPIASALADQLRGDAAASEEGTLDRLLDIDLRELAAGASPPPSRVSSVVDADVDGGFVEAPTVLPDLPFDDTLGSIEADITDADLTALIDSLEPEWPAAFTLDGPVSLDGSVAFDPPVAETLEPLAFPIDEPIAAETTAAPRATTLDLSPTEEIEPELAEVFAQEAAEHLQTIARITTGLSPSADDRESLQELRRAVHTLKGAAGVVGYKAASRLAHCMEDLLDRLYEGTAVLTPDAVRLLATTSDTLDESINGTGDGVVLRTTIARLIADFDGLRPRAGDTASPDVAPANEQIIGADLPVSPAEAGQHAELTPDRRSGTDRRNNSQVLRVPVARLDDLVRSVSELVLNRSTFEQHYAALIAQVEELKFSAARIRKVAQRLEADYEVRALAGNSMSIGQDGFDALEFDRYTDFHLLTRELTETASDVATISARVSDSIDDFDGDLTRLGRLTREIQDKTLEFRMLPVRTLATRLERTVRVTADACGKRVNFAIEGEDVTLDKSLLEHLADPLLHLLRNAVDHGIESAEDRRAVGKPEQGRIVVRAFHDGTDVVVEVEDDGKGLDVERIRRTAVQRGLIGEADAARVAPEALFDYIFEPGFSTASRVSEISGRGVGMDVVKSAVVRAGGRIHIDSRAGAGVTMSVRAPMTLAITRVLLVRAGGQTFGLPLGAVVQIVRPHPSAISHVGDDRVLTVDGRAHRLRDLADVLGLARTSDAPVAQPVLIANLGGTRIALAVDAILHSRDAVVKSLGTHLRRVPGIWGATLLGDGTVVLILNAADLGGAADEARVRVVSRPEARVEPQTCTVLVVDDSLSMRHVLSTTIRKAGWNVLQARDGLDALEVVHRAAQPPHAILLDIEMPRMDGYEFLSTIRAVPAYARLPIVMLTSRGSEKHRDKAKALGATAYLVKPFRDDVLIETITRVVHAAPVAKKAAS
jgi:chemosensory pili system protein ChpA (sensor histidine kinase/response regulator)